MGSVDASHLDGPSTLDYVTPSGIVVPTFRVVCEQHGEVTASASGLCCSCFRPLEFVAA